MAYYQLKNNDFVLFMLKQLEERIYYIQNKFKY